MFRIAPLGGETTSSLICRIASRYGLEPRALRSCWQWRNTPPPLKRGGVRADAEVLLNRAGQELLATLCGVGQDVLARALPSWGCRDAKLAGQRQTPAAVWRIAGAVVGPVAFGCRLCTARRTGTAVRMVRYAARSSRVCARHGRWLLDADADQELEHLDLRGVPEAVAAQQRWTAVARRAVQAGAEPERVFALAQAVVARWWEQALVWERETIWPRRLDQVAGGNAGADLARWRIVGRDTVVLPEVVAVAEMLLDPAVAELVWRESVGQPPPLPDAMLWRRLGERVGRPWLGRLAASDYNSPLTSWMTAVIRRRRGQSGPYGNDPWRVHHDHRPATLATRLQDVGKETKAPSPGRMWRAVVHPEQRARISSAIDHAAEQLLQLRGLQDGPAADVAQQLVHTLRHSTTLIDDAVTRTTLAAANAGMPLDEIAPWTGMPADALQTMGNGGQAAVRLGETASSEASPGRTAG
ncbi:DNA-binding protein [Streptomyces sp. NPDC005483]|uniref:DNA-binding protein n=1 Tax=Streptomyces sp. NPDC005483 TaxID=3154882 RepID=UPI0033A87AFE